MIDLINKIIANCSDLSTISTEELQQVVNYWETNICNGRIMDDDVNSAYFYATNELNNRV